MQFPRQGAGRCHILGFFRALYELFSDTSMLSRLIATTSLRTRPALSSGRTAPFNLTLSTTSARLFSTPVTQRAAVVHEAGDADQLKLESAWPVPKIGEWRLIGGDRTASNLFFFQTWNSSGQMLVQT